MAESLGSRSQIVTPKAMNPPDPASRNLAQVLLNLLRYFVISSLQFFAAKARRIISGVPPGQRTIPDLCRNLRLYLSGRQCGPSGPRSLRGVDAGLSVTCAAEISKIIEKASAEKPSR